ncbi:serine hydrolase domain-containing protein [Phytomonospora endophytica]|uniref:D-alanyl-D-alanine carboxypeptidase n=1 Tax=Phytomonospora endophytica TaxID=714109 RepID=A0A841FRX8_9ACTN|nr:serine hydrolase domain-containing protein [Phytomonospora endophytica]MBB6037563.1 D-alanyl-D-alanine carboxypeptidase [Phytomonospora endophytica]GIG70264.1 serine hydrolase [Phytomonospora endophytica]
MTQDSNTTQIPAPSHDRPELRKTLQDIADPESGFVGVTLRVTDENGEWAGAAGTAERGGLTPPPIDGHFRIGSNTKTFTATVVLQLVGEGRIGLDTPIADYLPEFGFDERITVRMVLQHTSGIFNFTGEVFEDGSVVPGIVWSGAEWVNDRFRTYTPEELVRLAVSKPVRFEPGADWSYANTNYVIARLIVEKVTGRSLTEEMDRLIFQPLGLTGTSSPETSTEVPEPHAHAYYRYTEEGEEKIVDVTSQNPSWISTGGDMIGTTKDLQTFIIALVSGDLLTPELREEMFTPEAKVGYGLGVFVQEIAGVKLITHNGGISGHAGLMFATPDGTKTLTASLNYVDDPDLSMATAFQGAVGSLLTQVFGGGEAQEEKAAEDAG